MVTKIYDLTSDTHVIMVQLARVTCLPMDWPKKKKNHFLSLAKDPRLSNEN